MLTVARSLVRSQTLRPTCMLQASQARQAKLKVVVAGEGKDESYAERNERLKRPISPHLSIYKPQLTSMLSIMHRGTGAALTIGAYGIGLGALMCSHDISHYVTMVEGLQLSSASLIMLKFILAYPLGYHTANGVRHLLWDTGRFLKIKEVYSTGYVMVGVSVVLTAILALL